MWNLFEKGSIWKKHVGRGYFNWPSKCHSGRNFCCYMRSFGSFTMAVILKDKKIKSHCTTPGKSLKSIFLQILYLLFFDIKPPNNQSCFLQLFFSWAVEKGDKLFIDPKLTKNLFGIKKFFLFFFNCWNWGKFVKKNWGKNWLFGGLMSWPRY